MNTVSSSNLVEDFAKLEKIKNTTELIKILNESLLVNDSAALRKQIKQYVRSQLLYNYHNNDYRVDSTLSNSAPIISKQQQKKVPDNVPKAIWLKLCCFLDYNLVIFVLCFGKRNNWY